MKLRDAVEADAGRLAGLTDHPRDVMRNLIHDRSVRVAEEDGDITGFVSFDAHAETVHVTQIQGSTAVYERLLEEPIRFASAEGMAVELLVPTHEDDIQEAAVESGFDERGSGPRFGGEPTVRFRYDNP